jgi:hypothetical protein
LCQMAKSRSNRAERIELPYLCCCVASPPCRSTYYHIDAWLYSREPHYRGSFSSLLFWLHILDQLARRHSQRFRQLAECLGRDNSVGVSIYPAHRLDVHICEPLQLPLSNPFSLGNLFHRVCGKEAPSLESGEELPPPFIRIVLTKTF